MRHCASGAEACTLSRGSQVWNSACRTSLWGRGERTTLARRSMRLASSMLVLLAACAGNDEASAPPTALGDEAITVGSFGFDESVLLAEIYSQALVELPIVRQLWDAGIAHRDRRPANLLVKDAHVHLIDVAFVHVRPSPWREAVDLAEGGNPSPALELEAALAVQPRAALVAEVQPRADLSLCGAGAPPCRGGEP